MDPIVPTTPVQEDTNAMPAVGQTPVAPPQPPVGDFGVPTPAPEPAPEVPVQAPAPEQVIPEAPVEEPAAPPVPDSMM